MFYIEISTEKQLIGFNYDMYDTTSEQRGWRIGIYMFLENNPSPGGGGYLLMSLSTCLTEEILN